MIYVFVNRGTLGLSGTARLALLAGVLLGTGRMSAAWAVPPLVAGDVPTADKGHLEVYLGGKYHENGGIEREIPFLELVYGVTGRQEITCEAPYVSVTMPGGQGARGVGDAVPGTKVVIVRETDEAPGIAASFEVKLANGNVSRGLGSGAVDYDALLRFQKSWGWFTGIWNLGYTIVGEHTLGGAQGPTRTVLHGAFAQMYDVAPRTRLLTEVYAENSEEPGGPTRTAGDVGFAYRVWPWLQVHGTIGRSLRSGDEGGPGLRAYAGVKLEFPLDN